MMNKKHTITVLLWVGLFTPMSAWGQQTFTTRVTYDNLAQIERFEFPDGSCVQYQYDNEMGIASRVTYQSGTENQTFVSDISLNKSGLVTSVDIENGQKTYGYDSLNQLTEQRFEYGGTTLYRAKNMAYNHLGGLKRLTRQDVSFNGTIQYGYTEQGQLRTFKLGSQTATYRYDAHGNLTTVNGFSTSDGLEVPAYGAGHNAYKDNNRNRNWDYDAEGRLLRDDTHQYYYDLTGRLAMVRDLTTGIPLQSYLYDGGGNRVRTSDIRSGSVTYTARDGSGAIITERVDHSTAPDRTTNTIHHNGETIATWTWEEGADTPEKEQIFNDYLGSPAVVVSDTDITNYEYGPFGQQMSEPRNTGSHGYTGHEEDEATDLTYMMARYYDASTARFLTPDPARDFNPYQPASYNLYEYARNDSVNFTDPTGLEITIANEESLAHLQETLSRVLHEKDLHIIDLANFKKQKDGSYVWTFNARKGAPWYVKELSELSTLKGKTANIIFLKDDGVVTEINKTSKEIQDQMGFSGVTPTPVEINEKGDLVDKKVDFINTYTFDITTTKVLTTLGEKETKMGESYFHEAIIHALPYFKGEDSHHGQGEVDNRSRKLQKQIIKAYKRYKKRKK